MNGGLSPGLLSRRVTSTGGRQLSDQPLALASRNPSQPLQIVVPRTCDDSCTPLLKREPCQVGASALGRRKQLQSLQEKVKGCLVMVRECTAMERIGHLSELSLLVPWRPWSALLTGWLSPLAPLICRSEMKNLSSATCFNVFRERTRFRIRCLISRQSPNN